MLIYLPKINFLVVIMFSLKTYIMSMFIMQSKHVCLWSTFICTTRNVLWFMRLHTVKVHCKVVAVSSMLSSLHSNDWIDSRVSVYTLNFDIFHFIQRNQEDKQCPVEWIRQHLIYSFPPLCTFKLIFTEDKKERSVYVR